MSKGVNKVIVVGNLGQDPSVKYTQSGSAVCNLSVAVGERKKNGEEWVDHTEWVRVVCFGRTAENVAQYMAKGKQIYVEGRMSTSKYTDKDGVEKWSTDVIAREVLFLSSGGGEREDGRTMHPQHSRGGGKKDTDANKIGGNGGGFYDDDLPF